MSLLTRMLPNICSTIKQYKSILQQASHFHSLTSAATPQLYPTGPFSIAVRTKVRVYFPRPSERRRIKRHGYWQRMKTPEGRRILMNRILKGRWVISH